jgi:hypothetical protein
MKRHSNILIFGLTLVLFACNSSADRQEKSVVQKSLTVDSIKKTELQTEINSVKDFRDDCIRGQAEPIIKKTVFPNTKFILQQDSLTAIETVIFDNGDKLTIRNWGCEYYMLTFRFETSRFEDDTSNIQYWYKKTVLLVSELYKGLDAPIDIKKGINNLINHIDLDMLNNYENLKFGQEIDFGGDEIRDFVTLEKVERLNDKKYAITISFSTGPL